MIHGQQQNIISRPIVFTEAGRQGRKVYTLPTRGLARPADPDNYLPTRTHMLAQVMDQAIDVRVDWDGGASSQGHFEVLVDSEVWQACENIDAGDANNDVVSPATALANEVFMVRFLRSPTYQSSLFGVKAIPIVWASEVPDKPDPMYVAVRSQDYEYADGTNPELIPWTYSVLGTNEVQQLNLELAIGCDYEVWVRLQDPMDANRWLVQDPIIRTGGGGGNPY